MKPIVYNSYRRPDEKSMVEHPDTTRVLETTGYERIEKTVNRLMLAGYNLYMSNRNYQFDGNVNPDDEPIAISKFSDEKDINMAMREIMKRLKRKVNRDVNETEEKGPEPVEAPVEDK